MSKEGRSTNVQIVPASLQALPSSLGLRDSFVIGNSSFVIRIAAPPSDRLWWPEARERSTPPGQPSSAAPTRPKMTRDRLSSPGTNPTDCAKDPPLQHWRESR